RMTYAGALCANLAKLRRSKILSVDRDCGRALGTAVTFKRSDPETVFKCDCDPLGQLFRPSHHILQAAKVFGRAAPHIGLQERGRCQQKRDGVLADQGSNCARFQRIGMEYDPHSDRHWQTKSAGESEGVKERQDAEDFVVAAEHEDLVELLDIRSNVVVAKDYSLGIAGTAAGKDNRGGVIKTRLSRGANRFFDKPNWQEPGNQSGCDTLHEAWLISEIL